MKPLSFTLCLALTGAAQAQSAARAPAPWWSIAVHSAEPGRLAALRGPDSADPGPLWAVSARYPLPAGTFRIGYGARHDAPPAPAQWSVGYTWSLSRRTLWYADTVQPRLGPRTLQIGIKNRD